MFDDLGRFGNEFGGKSVFFFSSQCYTATIISVYIASDHLAQRCQGAMARIRVPPYPKFVRKDIRSVYFHKLEVPLCNKKDTLLLN